MQGPLSLQLDKGNSGHIGDGHMNSGSSQGQAQTIYRGIRVQSATFGTARALVYGATRVTVNLIWYGAFKANAQDSGGK